MYLPLRNILSLILIQYNNFKERWYNFMENSFFVRSVLIGISLVCSVAIMKNSKSGLARFIGLLLYLVVLIIIFFFWYYYIKYQKRVFIFGYPIIFYLTWLSSMCSEIEVIYLGCWGKPWQGAERRVYVPLDAFGH